MFRCPSPRGRLTLRSWSTTEEVERTTYDREADAIYIKLADGDYAYGHDLDDSRPADFDADGAPIGIELLNVSVGVEVQDLPARQVVETALHRSHVRIYA